MTHYGSLSDLHTIVKQQYNEELYMYFNQIAFLRSLLFCTYICLEVIIIQYKNIK